MKQISYDETVYHATSIRNLQDILNSGLEPRTTNGSNHFLYTATNIDVAHLFSTRHDESVIIAFELHCDDLYRVGYGDVVMLQNTIDPKRFRLACPIKISL